MAESLNKLQNTLDTLEAAYEKRINDLKPTKILTAGLLADHLSAAKKRFAKIREDQAWIRLYAHEAEGWEE